jgi:hypothetical protein
MLQNPTARRGRHPGGAKQILDRQRQPGQRPRLAARQRRIRRGRLRQSELGCDRDKRVDPGIDDLDRVEKMRGQLARRKALAAQPVTSRRQREIMHAHSTTFGTA